MEPPKRDHPLSSAETAWIPVVLRSGSAEVKSLQACILLSIARRTVGLCAVVVLYHHPVAHLTSFLTKRHFLSPLRFNFFFFLTLTTLVTHTHSPRSISIYTKPPLYSPCLRNTASPRSASIRLRRKVSGSLLKIRFMTLPVSSASIASHVKALCASYAFAYTTFSVTTMTVRKYFFYSA